MPAFNRGIQKMFVSALSVLVCCTSSLAAENHVVPIAELHRQIASASQARQANLAKAEQFFSLEPVQNALRTAGLDGAGVQKAVASLDDDELARLAERTSKVQADLAGGALTNQQLTYIIIALATAVIILIITEAR